MKKTIRIPSLILAIFFLVSCQDKLEEYNPAGLTADAVYTTPEGFETAINAAYTYSRWMWGKEEGYQLFEMGTDIWTSGTGDTRTSLTRYENLVTTDSYVETLWRQYYAAINLINTAMSKIDAANLSSTRRPIAEAELRYLRAWYYWQLVETFGDIHFSLEPTQGIVTVANKTSPEKVYEQIFADLTFAVANLPAPNAMPIIPPSTTRDYGRVNKAVAEAFLARMYLTRGKNEEASALAKKVITSYGFTLLPNYASLWSMSNLRNAEIIWALNYSSTLSFNDRNVSVNGTPIGLHSRGSHSGHLLFAMKYDVDPGMKRDIAHQRPFNRYMPTLFFLNLFDEANDSRYEGSFRHAWYANNAATIPKWTAAEATQNPLLLPLVGQPKFALGDTAIFATKYEIPNNQQLYSTKYRYRVYDLSAVYNADGTVKDRTHYISLKKFEDPTRAAVDEAESSRDAFLIRLAEMHLIVAEAEFKLGRSDVAKDYLNNIRRRAALPGKTAAMEITAAQVTLDFILDERARELGGEQFRWFDLKRTGKLIERVKLYNPDAKNFIKDFHVLRPIPQKQLDAVSNKDEFKQNLGYN